VTFLVAALVTMALPGVALTWAPILCGPSHLVSGARHLTASQERPRSFLAGFGITGLVSAIATITLGASSAAACARVLLLSGLGWALWTLLTARTWSAGRRTVLAALLTAYAVCTWIAPEAFVALLIASHNLVSLGIAFAIFERSSRRPRAILAVLLGLALVLLLAPKVPGSEMVVQALGLGSPRLALALLYLQLCHYLVWLTTIPRACAAPFDGRWAALASLALLASVSMIILGPRLGGAGVVRTTYLGLAGFHVIAELVALIDLAPRHRRVLP
jgi:hypothetical protein